MNRDTWLLLISILIFTGLGAYYLSPGWFGLSKEKVSTPSTRPGVAQAVARGSAGRELAETAPVGARGEVVKEDTPWGRNPFLTEAEAGKGKEPVGEGLKVKAIIKGRGRSVATIDGRTVGVGEKVGEETVVDIRQDSVVLEMNGVKRILRVSEPSISIQVVKEGKR